jgi:hypothetical protein
MIAQDDSGVVTHDTFDHVADKVCAILERHDGRPSTRYRT